MAEMTADQLTAMMLRHELFVVTTRPARGPGIQALLPEHLEYQIRLEREGHLFGAGPIYDEGADLPSAGMIVLRAKDMAAARALADADPFHQKGLRQYTIQRWLLNEGAMTVTIRYSDRTAVIASGPVALNGDA